MQLLQGLLELPGLLFVLGLLGITSVLWTFDKKQDKKQESIIKELRAFKESVIRGQQSFEKEQQTINARLLALLDENRSTRSTAFSGVTGGKANQLLTELALTETDGLKAALHTPPGDLQLNSFDYSQYPDENSGTPDFINYHREQLGKCGVLLGSRGYQVMDLHKNSRIYNVTISGRRYCGGVDGAVVPHDVAATSAPNLLRIGFEHKQSTEDKASYHRKNPKLSQDPVEASRPYSFSEGRAQVICCLLAAHAMCQLPLYIDLTDGKKHHLLSLRGNMLLVYKNCEPTQAYYEMAHFLTVYQALLTDNEIRKEPPDDLPQEISDPIRKLKDHVQGASWIEQAQSLLSFCSSKEDQVGTAYDIARQWVHPVPDCVSALLET